MLQYALFLVMLQFVFNVEVEASGKSIFCYYSSSANARPGVGKFWPEYIDPFLCSHLIFAFVDITKDGKDLKPNNWNDLGPDGLYKRTMALKTVNPKLKILMAVGGWKIGSKPFLPVVKNKENIRIWVKNVITYLRKYKFDGLDMDWEFPGTRGSKTSDKPLYTFLMKELYESFEEEADKTGNSKLLLTMATASSSFYISKAYEPKEIIKYMDYMLLMTYNYHGSGWEKKTGHHSPLWSHPDDSSGEQKELHQQWSIDYWLSQGIPKEKLIVGLPTYGLTFKLKDPDLTGVHAPADGGAEKGKYTGEQGILSFYEICEKIQLEDWTVEWIDSQKVPFAHGNGEWVGFENPDSIALKADNIVKRDLAGAFLWSVEMDDFSGHCGEEKYPLISAVYKILSVASDYDDGPSSRAGGKPPISVKEKIQFECKALGLFAAPKSCEHFYICVPADNYDFRPILMNCPAGTRFDSDLKICNHAYLIDCD
ncbi:acidic mammalian chitinase-like [Octopus vulgaris]|uniref:Acidic mammalian chitinase-like n=1 Tax=Octopus vulgaris TaxID=6645 RepID=A0AA36B9S5_OCTVU|nr:acidic mammalian chitinase-like [Octopus vulgaris]